MTEKEVLNEEKYQETNKKMKKAGTIMLIIGGLLFLAFLVGIILQIALQGKGTNPMLLGVFGFIGVLGLPIFGIGVYLRFIIPNGRNITSYLAQQQMPVVKEGTEKVAPAVGTLAKEVTKGIKEGLKDEKPKKK